MKRFLPCVCIQSCCIGASAINAQDLTGKANVDKPSGTTIETPHVHEHQIHTSPDGKTNLGTKTTRPATSADVQKAREILTKGKP
jgi:hypothetical protein